MEATKYDRIGKDYDATRVADPYLAQRIFDLLEAVPGKRCLDVGCGTGNYLNALMEKGLLMHGVDPSELMLEKARSKSKDAQFVTGHAEALPFPDQMFDGAIAILTIHHWKDIEAGFKEISRVLKSGRNFVCFSFTTQQSQGYWLNHYFPGMMKNTFGITPDIEEMKHFLLNAGFTNVEFEPYYVKEDLCDYFLYASKYKPERYLIPEIRSNTSAFSYYANDSEEIENGLRQLQDDIASRKIKEVIKSYENEHGDYLFIKAANDLVILL